MGLLLPTTQTTASQSRPSDIQEGTDAVGGVKGKYREDTHRRVGRGVKQRDAEQALPDVAVDPGAKDAGSDDLQPEPERGISAHYVVRLRHVRMARRPSATAATASGETNRRCAGAAEPRDSVPRC